MHQPLLHLHRSKLSSAKSMETVLSPVMELESSINARTMATAIVVTLNIANARIMVNAIATTLRSAIVKAIMESVKEAILRTSLAEGTMACAVTTPTQLPYSRSLV